MTKASDTAERARSFSWTNEEDRLAAKAIALRWIAAEPRAHLVWSTRHFIGTMTAATFASESQRLRVWHAIRMIDPRVWQLARLRNDYPNNAFDQPLKAGTKFVYGLVRVFSVTAFLLGMVTIVMVGFGVIRRTRVRPGVAIGAFGFAWVALHGLTVGLTTFPEFRFVYVTLWGYLFFGVAAIALLLEEGKNGK